MSPSNKIDVQDIDHLGIIAAIIDDIGIVEIIDRELGSHPQEKVSAGQAVKAMILNCMGFLTAPLYLFSDFFTGKATEHLIGKGVEAEYLNESRLGRVMDQIYKYGITLLFVKIASVMANKFGISSENGHLDDTSISVHGQYKIEGEDEILVEDESSEPIGITITHGYSREHRPDLKQFTLHLLTSEEEGIPLFMNVGNGNTVDQSAFPEVIKAFRSQWQGEQTDLFTMDAAFFNEPNLKDFGDSIKWISRVPETIKAAQELTEKLLPEQFTEYDDKGYRFCTVCSNYAGIKQQWVVVESRQRMESDLKNSTKKVEKSLTDKEKKFNILMNKEFACEADAISAINEFKKTLKYHSIDESQVLAKAHYAKKGRPNLGQQPTHQSFYIRASLVENPLALATLRQKAGRFVLATNSLDDQKWSDSKILREYKGQQPTERGFRFLKDPLFFASSIFLKNTKRIMALAMLMTLALMVYSLGQRQLRLALQKASATLPDQKGKPNARPTLRWILQCFLSVHLIFLDDIKFQIKLSERQLLILQFLSASSRKYYFLS
jgi:transposase